MCGYYCRSACNNDKFNIKVQFCGWINPNGESYWNADGTSGHSLWKDGIGDGLVAQIRSK